MKKSTTFAAVLLTGSLLAACGGGSGAYCDDLKDSQAEFASFEESDFSKLDDAFETFRELADAAPGEIKDDWAKLDEAISTMQKAFEDAGLDLSDLGDLQPGQMPDDFDPEKLAGLGEALSSLDSDEFTKAAENIEKHAKDECGVDLS